MEENKEQVEKKKFLYSYTEEQINAILNYLGDKPAKDVFHLISAMKSPVKVDEVV